MNKALIVIDVQKYFLTNDSKVIVNKIKNYLENKAREYERIYFTIFKNDGNSSLWKISGWQGCVNSPDTDICEKIKRFINQDNLFYKNFLSAAKVPQIIQEIKKNNFLEVHLCGFDTDCCVLATAYDLFDLGFKPVILENLTWSTSEEKLHNTAIQMIKRNIGFVKNTNE